MVPASRSASDWVMPWVSPMPAATAPTMPISSTASPVATSQPKNAAPRFAPPNFS
jgi:hypothetical protein